MKGAVLLAGLVIGIGYLVARPHDPRVVAPAPPVETLVVRTPAPAAAPGNVIVPGQPMLVPGDETVIPRAANGHFYADADVDGQSVRMVVDTGATGVALTVDDARRLGFAVDPGAFQVIGSGASGAVRGTRLTLGDVAVGGRHARDVDAAVIEGLEMSLLGQSYLRQLEQVDISGDSMRLR